jgi:hypothetical protein
MQDINWTLDEDRTIQRGNNPELFDRITAEYQPTKLVRELRASDTAVYWPGLGIAYVLDNERLGYGQWRVTLSPISNYRIVTEDVPGNWIIRLEDAHIARMIDEGIDR